MERMFTVAVEGEAGEGEGIPRCFHLGTRRIEVAELLDRWPGADHTYLKLRGTDGATYLLRWDRDGGIWQLVQFVRGGTLLDHGPAQDGPH